MGNMIKVGMADLNTCKTPDAITTLGLGSCIGVVLYDPRKKICGMVHVMLPDSTAIKNNDNVAKFADTGIKALLDQLEKIGVTKSSLSAKIAGGAQMFAFNTNNDMLKVGQRNAESVRKVLQGYNIRIVAEDCGANYGRTIEFYPETSELYIKAIGKPLKII
ncbi:MAG: chemotaxis protein CheD [Lachnospiraceae bacterium]|nr:chemotaxis protein CheD [Lachnospiraceae bacterium]